MLCIRDVSCCCCCLKGDSFILAFFTPANALDYALLAQQHLMEADWPAPLLDSPDAAQVGIGQDGGVRVLGVSWWGC